MRISGDVRPGQDFRLEAKPHNVAAGAFIALSGGEAIVTRRLSSILHLPDDTPVIANWHGQRRTDAFATTVGRLRDLASISKSTVATILQAATEGAEA